MKTVKAGLTGGIGAGKSLALKAFSRLGADVVSLDAVSREVTRPGTPGHRRVARAFGRAVMAPDGGISRARLGAVVFSDPARRRKLERLLHPLILREMRRRLRVSRRPVAVADVPLLFEAGLAREFDLTILIDAPRAARLRRVIARDGLSRAEVFGRMAAQMPEARKRALADVVIANDKSPKDLSRTVRAYYKALELMSQGA